MAILPVPAARAQKPGVSPIVWLAAGLCAAVVFAATVPPAFAQSSPAATEKQDRCAEPPQEAATPPPSGPSSGTAPGADGSTAWTGGTGGSYIGTSPGAPTPGSPDKHPETVKGVDPKPQAPSRAPC